MYGEDYWRYCAAPDVGSSPVPRPNEVYFFNNELRGRKNLIYLPTLYQKPNFNSSFRYSLFILTVSLLLLCLALFYLHSVTTLLARSL